MEVVRKYNFDLMRPFLMLFVILIHVSKPGLVQFNGNIDHNF